MMKTRSLLFLPMVLLSACASQNDLNYVQGEVSQLKQESQVIKQQSAGSYSEITQYREEIAGLRGSLNELQYNYQGSMKRLDMEDSLQVSKSNELENRIARIEKYLGLELLSAKKPGITPAPVVPPKGGPADAPASAGSAAPEKPIPPSPKADAAPAFSGADSAESQLNEGLLLMEKKDYAGARERFKAFMNSAPKSPKVSDAQFYLAETYFDEQWYEKAILEYQVVIAKYTKSSKRPAALYKQGLAFEKIGDKANANARYKDVVNLYPGTPEARLGKKSLTGK
ncbi:MAG: tol-pal system protein YbgF [Chlorobiaceae bacterium]|nr:tol-pal system protein YbgF [Chlorobiaceae bacterium]